MFVGNGARCSFCAMAVYLQAVSIDFLPLETSLSTSRIEKRQQIGAETFDKYTVCVEIYVHLSKNLDPSSSIRHGSHAPHVHICGVAQPDECVYYQPILRDVTEFGWRLLVLGPETCSVDGSILSGSPWRQSEL
jgi:hypothetical protein